MRKAMQQHPSVKDVRREVRSLCKQLGLAGPSVRFWKHRADGMYYKFDDGESRVYLPDPSWCLEIQPDLQPTTYWMLVFHEVAHYVSDMVHGKHYHCPEMYAILIGIVLKLGLPLDYLHLDEDAYLPRAWERGRKHAGNLLLRNLTTNSTV